MKEWIQKGVSPWQRMIKTSGYKELYWKRVESIKIILKVCDIKEESYVEETWGSNHTDKQDRI